MPYKNKVNEEDARQSTMPYRMDLAGGWLDQPYVSKHHSGSVITISLEPTHFFNFRSGFATSTRNSAIQLWGDIIPSLDYKKEAELLFCYDNPPGTKEIAGSQDSIGIVVPGLNSLFYNGEYWPEKITSYFDDGTLDWLEEKISFVELKPRGDDYDVFKEAKINKENARKLAFASDVCLEGILEKDFQKFALGFTDSFKAQTKLFPSSFPDWIEPIINDYRERGAKGWKLSGAGGGGYLIFVSDEDIEGTSKIKIRKR